MRRSSAGSRTFPLPTRRSIVNLFGLLPFTAPTILHLGVWPLIMGITMFLQMRMNPTPPDPTQAMIFTWMPLVFMFMLSSFPAGLVIYWAWNNTLSVIQQSIIMKRHGVKVELFDNLKEPLPTKNGAIEMTMQAPLRRGFSFAAQAAHRSKLDFRG